MADPLKRVTRWTPHVVQMLDRYGLAGSVDVYQVLAQIGTESTGWPRPEAHVGDHYKAEGLLQMQPIAAKDAGYTVTQIDGLDDPRGDAIRSIDAWGKLQRRYTGQNAPYWDYPLLWLAGSGTQQRARQMRNNGGDYWQAWYTAADETGVTGGYVYEYAQLYHAQALAYWKWQTGQQGAT